MYQSKLRRAFRRYIPFWVGQSLRRLYYYPADIRDVMLRRRKPLSPSRVEAAFVGDGDFAGMGRRFLDHFITLGGLQPEHSVLDIGCGIGRMAVPLTGFLSPQAHYSGFDPVADGIDWCNQHITPQFPNFRFFVANVWSKSYNRRGAVQASDYVFPFPDSAFDFAFATSVFTHMVPKDVENYLANIARVLRPGGRCFVTYFLLNETTRRASAAADFCYPVDSHGTCLAVSKVEFEKAVAFDETFIRSMYTKHGLVIVEPVRYGRWGTPKGGPAYQDIIVAKKAQPQS
jgi:ubiquinone/menaquinone biosynthesis C-methylase UbiE